MVVYLVVGGWGAVVHCVVARGSPQLLLSGGEWDDVDGRALVDFYSSGLALQVLPAHPLEGLTEGHAAEDHDAESNYWHEDPAGENKSV